MAQTGGKRISVVRASRRNPAARGSVIARGISAGQSQIKFFRKLLVQAGCETGAYGVLALKIGRTYGTAGAQRQLGMCKRLVLDGATKDGGDKIARAAAQILLVFQAAAQLKADFVRRPPVDPGRILFVDRVRAASLGGITSAGANAGG